MRVSMNPRHHTCLGLKSAGYGYTVSKRWSVFFTQIHPPPIQPSVIIVHFLNYDFFPYQSAILIAFLDRFLF